ncbi:hypothetical protein [Microcoleus sp. S28C3]|uniref:hypothetical protein n=1 Tax=Microcoleus sp. S28C3 TaxID=3055414 RepID=UPI002FCEBD9F
MLNEEEIFSHSSPLPISPTPPLPLSPTPAMLKAELVGVFVSTATAISMPAGSI